MAKIDKEELQSIEHLKELFLKHDKQKYPNIPDFARVTPKYKTTDSKGLIKAIKDYVTFSGGRFSNADLLSNNRVSITVKQKLKSMSVVIEPKSNTSEVVGSLHGFILWYKEGFAG